MSYSPLEFMAEEEEKKSIRLRMDKPELLTEILSELLYRVSQAEEFPRPAHDSDSTQLKIERLKELIQMPTKPTEPIA